ncbi:hypothetical protein OE09_1401 [Flavobacteriaceae bacterium MAR_2010_72]|nr:hypothetical protein OE09_1401 [Flavobacteriaceae bacterium MAR_2010_72]TVZ59871.1 hypothetical protein NA63_2412 [Flavobacteriaceae bacterium MAR_2010_105]
MKYLSLIIINILLVNGTLFSQNLEEYAGAIKLSDSAIITYKVFFEINQSKVTGYTLTDLGGEHETKSNLVGFYDTNNNKLSFKETGIVYTKSIITQNDFCYIHFSPVNYKAGKTTYFKGTFKGMFNDGQQCIDGEIFLNSVEKINSRMEKITKKVNRSNRINDSIKDKFNNLKLMENLNLNMLKADRILSVFSEDKTINLELYDGGQEDGDVISIKVNGILVLDNFKITTKRKMIPITLSNNKTSIEIIAKTVGTISTNTAVIEINDSKNNIRALTNLKAGETTKIDILKR